MPSAIQGGRQLFPKPLIHQSGIPQHCAIQLQTAFTGVLDHAAEQVDSYESTVPTGLWAGVPCFYNRRTNIPIRKAEGKTGGGT